MNPQNREFFETVAKVLGRCFLLGAALLLVWFYLVYTRSDWVFTLNTRWFHIPREQLVIIHYCGMALLKIAVIVEFLIPYICLRLVLSKDRKNV